MAYNRGMDSPEERSVREVRAHLADVLYAAAGGQITYVTSRGRRIAAITPLPVADAAVDKQRQPQQP